MSAPQLETGGRCDVTSASPASPPTALDALVQGGARRLVVTLTAAGGPRGRDDWLAVAGDCQSLINTLAAVQDRALAEAARRESVWAEDGTLEEVVHGVGRVALDAADLAAPVIGASHHQAQRRVEQAVRLAAGRVPVEADTRDLPDASGLGRLHEAMATGHIDAYRAGVIAFELEVAPADVADAILSALSDHLRDDGPALRRRTRVLLSRISPDLVRERAKRARAATGLRRWVAEPGVDEWHGTFPSEDAAKAWAAIDRLAHDLVADGTCTSIEQARGKALTDLVTGNATVEVQVVMTVPAGSETHATAPPVTTEAQTVTADGEAPTATDRVTTEEAAPAAPSRDDAGDLVAVQGPRPSEPLLVPRGWLRDHLPKTPDRRPGGPRRVEARFVPCDPLTGARLDPRGDLSTDAYPPGTELAAMVRARDGRCRFPGCCVAATFCDLDHVRPWPMGRTAARNLLTLCRRHHRIKQRAGWRVRLSRDGTATWTDPAGRVRTTEPLDALHTVVLTDETDANDDATTVGEGTASDQSVPTGSGWSALETRLELVLEHWPPHRRCTSVAQLGTAAARRRQPAPVPDQPPF